jgi:hypothetical protein
MSMDGSAGVTVVAKTAFILRHRVDLAEEKENE